MHKMKALGRISMEHDRATKLHGPLMSSHEAYAVVLEELEEYWELVKSRQGFSEQALTEMVQVGAMALRTLIDTDTMLHR